LQVCPVGIEEGTPVRVGQGALCLVEHLDCFGEPGATSAEAVGPSTRGAGVVLVGGGEFGRDGQRNIRRSDLAADGKGGTEDELAVPGGVLDPFDETAGQTRIDGVQRLTCCVDGEFVGHR